jgi:segregation and condensation protein A
MREESDLPTSSEEVIDVLMDNDDVDWNSVLRGLVRDEGMDPWDIDLAVIADKFLGVIDDMQGTDFRLSGKMVLATAFFLKLKSDRLLDEDLHELDTMMMEPEELYDDLEEPEEPAPFEDVEPELVPHTPQPRKRKVSVQDLANALESALEKEQKNYVRQIQRDTGEETGSEPDVEAPEEERNIEVIIENVYDKIVSYFNKVKHITFSHLVEEDSRQEKIDTFIPLLHLDNQGKVALRQENPFDEIEVEHKDDQ